MEVWRTFSILLMTELNDGSVSQLSHPSGSAGGDDCLDITNTPVLFMFYGSLVKSLAVK